MTKRQSNEFTYQRGEREAEREIDAFLRSVSAPNGYDAIADLRQMTLP